MTILVLLSFFGFARSVYGKNPKRGKQVLKARKSGRFITNDNVVNTVIHHDEYNQQQSLIQDNEALHRKQQQLKNRQGNKFNK